MDLNAIRPNNLKFPSYRTISYYLIAQFAVIYHVNIANNPMASMGITKEDRLYNLLSSFDKFEIVQHGHIYGISLPARDHVRRQCRGEHQRNQFAC